MTSVEPLVGPVDGVVLLGGGELFERLSREDEQTVGALTAQAGAWPEPADRPVPVPASTG